MRTICLLCLIAVSLAATSLASRVQAAPPAEQKAATAPAPVRESILQGNLYLSRGLRDDALSAFDEATDWAESLPEGNDAESNTKAAALLESGKAYLQLPEGNGAADGSVAMEKAKTVLELVLRIGTPRQAAYACVYLANAEMKQGRPKAALEYLEQCEPEQFERHQQFVLSYNKARAHEGLDEVPDAIDNYLESLNLNPNFLQAAARAVDLAARTAPSDPSEVAATGDALLAGGYSDQAQSLASSVIRKSTAPAREDAATTEAVALLLRALAARFAGPEDEAVQRLNDDLIRAGALDAAADVRRILGEPFAIEIGTVRRRGRHPQLSDFWYSFRADEGEASMQKSWSMFVTAAANWFAGSRLDENQVPIGEPRDGQRAFALFLVAWGADPGNSRAASGLVALLTEESQRSLLDRHYHELMDALYFGKNQAYGEDPSTPADWLALLQYHVILAALFEERDEIGAPYLNRSALGQFELAVRAEQEVIELTDGQFLGSAPLYARLAACLTRQNDSHGAVDAWLTATERSLATEDLQAAADAIRAAEDLPSDPEQQQRLRELRARLPQ